MLVILLLSLAHVGCALDGVFTDEYSCYHIDNGTECCDTVRYVQCTGGGDATWDC